jgi:hypothetical protein
VSDAAGRVVRELDVPGAKNPPGIQSICWDMRGEPITAPTDSAAEAAGGRGGRGGRGAGGENPIPGVSQPVPTPINGMNPCAVDGRPAAGGRGGGRGGGGGIGGPGGYVMPGTYTVALTSNGKVLDSNPLKLVLDPEVKFAAGEHEKYNAIVADLTSLQARGVKVASALNEMYPMVNAMRDSVAAKGNVPANVKTQVESFVKDFDALRPKFGVPFPAPNAGGRGGGRGGGVNPENVLGRTSSLRNAIIGIWETPSASLSRQYNEVKVELPKAVSDANALLTRAGTLSRTLRQSGITFNPPAPPR